MRDVIIPQLGRKEGRHLKLLVLADISQPLMRGTIVKLKGVIKCNFRYERYPNFYYNCGVIRHSERSCKVLMAVERGQLENKFGLWLRASNAKGYHKRKMW